MIHPIKSIEAHYETWTLKHFECTVYSKRLKRFKNIHKEGHCFIIGNGPSLTPKDLDVLYVKRVKSFAFNRIYLMFDQTDWRPTYYISQDEKTLKNCQHVVNSIELPYKFIPLFHKYYHNIEISNAYYFNLREQVKGESAFSEDISSFIGYTTTVACTAIQMAVYMGFKKIYLIGVDHSFSTYQNDKGEIFKDSIAKDYFTKDYNPDKDELYIPNLDASTRAFIMCKDYCDAHEVEVYNATRGGKLEVFPRVDFDKIEF